MVLYHPYGGTDEPKLKIIDVSICKLRKSFSLACGGANCIEIRAAAMCLAMRTQMKRPSLLSRWPEKKFHRINKAAR